MRKYFAEFIGTFLLTFLACGVASFTAGYQGFLGVVGISLIFGFIVAVLCYSIGNISGCHINPAVSLGMLISKRMSIVDFMGYVIAQLLGGVAAGFAMLGISKTFSEDIISQYSSYGYNLLSFGTNGYGDASAFLQVNVWGALIIEFILTFVFVITVIGVTSKPARVIWQNDINCMKGLFVEKLRDFSERFLLSATRPNGKKEEKVV